MLRGCFTSTLEMVENHVSDSTINPGHNSNSTGKVIELNLDNSGELDTILLPAVGDFVLNKDATSNGDDDHAESSDHNAAGAQ